MVNLNMDGIKCDNHEGVLRVAVNDVGRHCHIGDLQTDCEQKQGNLSEDPMPTLLD